MSLGIVKLQFVYGTRGKKGAREGEMGDHLIKGVSLQIHN